MGDARSIIERFRGANVDLLSLSGHHASGFSGGPGRSPLRHRAAGPGPRRRRRRRALLHPPGDGDAPGLPHRRRVVVHRRSPRVHPSRDRGDRRPSQRVRSTAGGGAADRRRAAGLSVALPQRLHPRLLGDAGAGRTLRDLLPGQRLAARARGLAGGRERAAAAVRCARFGRVRKRDRGAQPEGRSRVRRGVALQPVRARCGLLRPAGARARRGAARPTEGAPERRTRLTRRRAARERARVGIVLPEHHLVVLVGRAQERSAVSEPSRRVAVRADVRRAAPASLRHPVRERAGAAARRAGASTGLDRAAGRRTAASSTTG